MSHRMVPTPKDQLAPFPSANAELPGIVVAASKDANAMVVAEEEEAEEHEVVENTDLDREVPHMAFVQKEIASEDHNI